MKKLFKIFSLALAIVLFASAVSVSATKTVSDEIPQILGVTDETEHSYIINYERIAANAYNILYADMEKGHFALKNIKSGEVWYSTPRDVLLDEKTSGAERWATYSQITVEYLYEEDILSATAVSSTSSQLDAVDGGSIDVKKIQNGIRVTYHFGDLGVTIPVEYYLSDEHFVASIVIDEIDEGEDCLLTSINLLPYFGAGGEKEKGELFVPDGSGALISFNNGANSSPYRSLVYGDDMVVVPELDSKKNETVRLPVFATLKENAALMGVITMGDGSASIRAVNGNETRAYNAVSSICEIRNLEQLTMFKRVDGNRRDIGSLTAWPQKAKRYEVTYTPISGDKANYTGVAEKYREYLIEEKGLTKKAVSPSVALDIYGAIDIKAAFLGFEYSKLKSLTTFKEAEKIISSLEEKGIDNLSVRYLGWSNYGLLNKRLPIKANALSRLGGNKGFKSLNNAISESENVLYADVDFVQYRSGNKKKAITNIFGEVAEHTERLRSVFATKLGLDSVKLLSPQYIEDTAEKYLKSLKEKGITSVSLSTLGDLCYSNSSKKIGFHRYYFPSTVENVLESYKNNGISVALDSANAYAAVYADRIYNSPVICSGYDMFDREIPFYQMVFHGYVATTVSPMAQAQEKRINFLKAVESGSELLYGTMYEDSSCLTGTRYEHLYSTNYELWLSDEAEEIVKYSELLSKIHNKKIVGHREVATNVTVTTFEGGITVTVNYNNTAVSVGKQKIDALDYIYSQGGEQ